VKLWEEKLLRYTIEHNAAKLNIMRGNATPQDHEKYEANSLLRLFTNKSIEMLYLVARVLDPQEVTARNRILILYL